MIPHEWHRYWRGHHLVATENKPTLVATVIKNETGRGYVLISYGIESVFPTLREAKDWAESKLLAASPLQCDNRPDRQETPRHEDE